MTQAPTFRTLGNDLPMFRSLLAGALLSLSILASFPALMGGPRHVSARWTSSRADELSKTQKNTVEQNSTTTAPPMSGLKLGSQSQWTLGVGHGTVAAENHVASTIPLDHARRHQQVGLDSTVRHQIILSAGEQLRLYYFDHNLAEKMSLMLLTHEKNGDDDYVTDPESFADLLTTQLRTVSDDRHLIVIYSRTPLPDVSARQQSQLSSSYTQEMRRTNCGFEKLEILQGNIGYLKLNSFPDISLCEETARRAMGRLNNVDSLIIDLRDNQGGFPDMVSFLASYLFDHPEYLYNPRADTTGHSWTRSPVAGNHLANKPVYLLTSERTISGAEQFTYNLKMLRRAAIIGQTTAGEAHAGSFHRLNDHFGIGILEVKPFNPYSKYDWAEIGIEPDVRVRAADALDEALRQIRSNQGQTLIH